MAFSAAEIETKEFLVGLRGYEKSEVSAFLRAVAADYRELERRARANGAARRGEATNATETKNGEAEPAVAAPGDGLDDIGEQVAAVLRTARQGAENIRRSAEAAAAQIKQAAEEEAARIVAEGEARRAELEEKGRAAVERGRELSTRLLDRARGRLANVKVMEQATRLRVEETEGALRKIREELQGSQPATDDELAAIDIDEAEIRAGGSKS